MKATDKFKLSRELNSLVSQVQAGDLKGLEKLKTSRRINEIVSLLGGGTAVTQANEDIDLSPFERIVRNNEITLETLQGAVSSSKMLLNSLFVPPVFVEAVKVVSGQVTSGALLDSLGAQGLELVAQLGNRLLDSINSPSQLQQLPDVIAQTAATSQVNEGENPTQAQLEANDYKTAKVTIAGMNIAIENPIGSIRKGVDVQGVEWQTEMTAHYGYFEDTLGADGDELDVFIAANTPHDYEGKVFVMSQLDPKGNFDEHKVMMGAATDHEAADLYRAHYDEQFNGIGQIIELTLDQFKARAYTGQTAFFDSLKPMMLDSWAADGRYELLPIKRLSLGKLDSSINEAKATVKDPIVVYMVNHKYHVIHGRNRLDIANAHAEKYIPSIVFDEAQNYSMSDIKQAIRKCGNVVHAEALGAMIEVIASQRLEAEL